jgi:hypothetical protein
VSAAFGEFLSGLALKSSQVNFRLALQSTKELFPKKCGDKKAMKKNCSSNFMMWVFYCAIISQQRRRYFPNFGSNKS